MSHVHVFPMHTYSLFHIFDDAWDFFDCSSLLLPLNLFTLVVFIAPKRKSTPTRNPLRSGASSSTDPSPSTVRFRDDAAFKAFIQNAKSFCRTLPTLTFPLSFTVGNGSHCLLSCLSKSSTPTCTGLIVPYLSFSLVFEVRAFLSHRNWLRMCFVSLG